MEKNEKIKGLSINEEGKLDVQLNSKHFSRTEEGIVSLNIGTGLISTEDGVAVNEQKIVENLLITGAGIDEKFDTLKEMAAYISSDATNSVSFQNFKNSVEKSVEGVVLEGDGLKVKTGVGIVLSEDGNVSLDTEVAFTKKEFEESKKDLADKSYVTDSIKNAIDRIPEQELLLSVTWSELKMLRDEGKLKVGSYYRITDYSTTTTQEGTQSAGHAFDVIVLALSNDSLSEDAKVVLRDGDEYFDNSDLSSWDIKYCLDNDTTRFAWADTENGKGVIYYMKDNRGNECPYDFKNIKMVGSNGAYLYTFDYNGDDYSVNPNSNCSNNIIKPCYDGAQKLNFITISVSDAYDQCCYNTFGINNSLIATKALDNSSFGDNIRGIDILAEYASYLNVASDNLGAEDYSFEIDDSQYELYHVNIGMSVVNGRGSLELETSNTYTTMVERGEDGEINIYSDLYGFVEGLSNSLNTLSSDVEALKTDGVYRADNSNYNNHANLVGYFGNLYNYGVKGENIEIKKITAYARSGSVANTELYCKVLIRVDGVWVKLFESKDPKTLQATEGSPIEFEMERKGDIALTDKDIIAIVFHDSNAEDATSNFTPTGMKTISIAGAIPTATSGSLALSPSIQTGWSPAFSFEYTLNREDSFTLHSDRDEDINSIKTFNKTVNFKGVVNATQNINIANKSTIASNIDSGELKVLHKNSLKGFIVRTVNGDADILPLEILTTNGYSSYKYSFPNQNGKVILDSNVGSGIKVENGQIKADMAYINSNITGGDGGGSGVSARVENGVLYL